MSCDTSFSAEYYTQLKGIRKDTDERVLGGKESFCVNPFLADQKKCVYGEEKGDDRMGRKQMITQILIRAYTIRTVLLFVAEAAWFILAENSFSGLFELMRATLILSLLSFAVSFLVSQEDRRISPSHAVLYAVFDVLIFSIGAGVFALMEMMGIQGGSGLAVVVIPILAGMVMLPFSIVLAVIAYRMIKQNITRR